MGLMCYCQRLSVILAFIAEVHGQTIWVLRCAISKRAGEICSNFANSYSFIIKAFNLKSELCYCCIIWSNMVSFFPYFYFIQEKVLFFPYCEFYKAIFSVFEFNLQTPQLWIGLVYPFGNCPCLHFVWIYFYTNWLCSWWQGMLSAVKGIDSDVNCPYVDKKKSGVKGHFHSPPQCIFWGAFAFYL